MDWDNCYSSERKHRYDPDSGVIQTCIISVLIAGALYLLFR